MRDLKLRRNERGISIIALVITIIVIIILAAIAFNSSTSTIGKANYSKFVSNISEVEQAINERMVEVKGAMLAKGSQITDGQAFNYVAKGGKTDEDFVVESRTPDYTIIEKRANIGIKLPVMRVNTPTETNVEVKYAVTKNGKVFIWPPYPSENAYNIRDKEFVDSSLVSSSGDIDITVAGTTFKLQVDGNSKLENRELLDDGLSKKEFEEVASKIKVGNYVNYEPTAVQNVETDVTKTGYTKEVLSTDTKVKWKILDIDEKTGKVMITTESPVNEVTLRGATGYLYGANELHRLCEELYSNTDKKLTAKSITMEILNNICNYSSPVRNEGCAWYLMGTPDEELKDVVTNGKKYNAIKHRSDGYVRFYSWDDSKGVRHIANNAEDYLELSDENEPVLVTRRAVYTYSPSERNSAIGNVLSKDLVAWTASTYEHLVIDYLYVSFGLTTVSANLVFPHATCISTGNTLTYTHGMYPVVSFNANMLNIANTSTDGASVSTAWNIK